MCVVCRLEALCTTSAEAHYHNLPRPWRYTHSNNASIDDRYLCCFPNGHDLCSSGRRVSPQEIRSIFRGRRVSSSGLADMVRDRFTGSPKRHAACRTSSPGPGPALLQPACAPTLVGRPLGSRPGCLGVSPLPHRACPRRLRHTLGWLAKSRGEGLERRLRPPIGLVSSLRGSPWGRSGAGGERGY